MEQTNNSSSAVNSLVIQLRNTVLKHDGPHVFVVMGASVSYLS